MRIRAYMETDASQFLSIWNEVVEEANAFPQEEPLTQETLVHFIQSQSYVGVLEENQRIQGVYILHPNNVGRCGHISNASFAVSNSGRGCGYGKALVKDCLLQAKILGFQLLQFNAVVKTNLVAILLYESLGFQKIGEIPDGFRVSNDHYETICIYAYKL